VLSGEHRHAFSIARPPGHHAERRRQLGFCLFNSIAVAAAYALREFQLERIAIVDWDVHHGNGTQHIFERDGGTTTADTVITTAATTYAMGRTDGSVAAK
jgi:acetoin utilization deacetylase AcuC-like enzyme